MTALRTCLTDLHYETRRSLRVFVLFLFSAVLLGGCGRFSIQIVENTGRKIPITVTSQSGQVKGMVDPGTTVSDALTALQFQFTADDIITPPEDFILNDEAEIRIISVTHSEETVEQVIPYESQTVRNETLPDGETYMIQMGKNGIELVTTRYTYQDGELTAKTISNRSVLQEAVPEILMLGAQADYASLRIPGKVLFVSNGNIWMMEGTTENRTALVTTGDVDGRILDLSSTGEWLLFTRKTKDDAINSLWMISLSQQDAEPISLRIQNIVHFAEWLPGDALRVIYSTAEPIDSAPGWRANNDLRMQLVGETGVHLVFEEILPPDLSGAYSWWGTEFHLSSDARTILFSNPEAIGTVDRLTGEKKKLISILPYDKTRSDWAWVPGVDWIAGDDRIVFSYHGDISGFSESYDPSDYNLGILTLDEEQPTPLIQKTGLFSYPVCSPLFSDGTVWIAYLQTLTPTQNEANRYRIMVTDLTGTETNVVFPAEEDAYIAPQLVVWAPGEDRDSTWLAFLSQKNLWIVNPFTGVYNQITSDQSIEAFIWR